MPPNRSNHFPARSIRLDRFFRHESEVVDTIVHTYARAMATDHGTERMDDESDKDYGWQ